MTQRLAIIGCGNMGRAIAQSSMRHADDNLQITVADPREEALQGLKCATVDITTDNDYAIRNSEVSVLAVKPNQMELLINTHREALCGCRLVITVAAGIPLAKYHQWLGNDSAVIRCVPNLPMSIQLGVSVLYAHESISKELRAQAQLIFETGGIVKWVENEADLHTVTALSGSGPAYFYYLMEHMIAQGTELGLRRELATEIVARNAMGAGGTVLDFEIDPEALRKAVMSRRGTTEQAINVLTEQQADQAIRESVQRCHDRSIQLAEEV